MSNEPQRYPSRLNKKNRSNSILNGMIGLVFTLILIVGAFIFLDGNDDQAQKTESVTIASNSEEQAAGAEEDGSAADDGSGNNGNAVSAETAGDEQETSGSKEEETSEPDEEGSVTIEGSITYEESDDPIVKETIINTGWKAIGTEQKGEHVSVYDKGSVDWQEKIEAISYATGLSESDMHIMMVQNGGGPQKSVGTVTSKDTSEKYRVYLEWVDGEGWKPVKMDVLNTLEGAY